MEQKVAIRIQIILAIISIFTLVTAITIFFMQYNNYYSISEAENINFDEDTTETNFINDTLTPSKKICTTVGCNETSNTLLNSINFNIDPCNNFYEFVCGNFIKNTKIPKDKYDVHLISKLTDKVEKQVMDIVSEPIRQDDIQPFILTKKLFKACMNEEIIEQRGLTPLKNIINKFGGWPVLENNKWNETIFSWNKTLIEIGKLGLQPNVLFSVYIDIDPKNNTNHVLTVDEAYLALSREYFIQGMENEVVRAYFELMNKVAIAMGADEKSARDELKESFDFEMTLVNLTLPSKERENISNLYNPTTIKQLQITYPSIPWLSYINNVLSSVVNITEDEIVINAVPEYIKQLEKLLKSTPKRIIANYVMWRTVKLTLQGLSRDYKKILDDFNSVISGVTVQPPRDKQCIEIIDDEMSIAIGALYVKKFFKNESKSQMNQLVKNLQMEFKYLLENVDWMDNKTKENALKKIVAVYAHVAYPEELMDDNKIIDYYKNLELNENMYLESILNLSVFANVKYIETLRQPFNKTKWSEHSYTATINAFYSPQANSIELPAGILQGDFFSNDRPKYMNYGGIGFVIGHEITHGFDNFGRGFNKDGNLVDWWQPSTSEAFAKKAECIINQYGNYSTGNLTLNGQNTHNENIADNGGAKCAYRAYKRWSEAHDPEPGLPGLSFTPNQMVWISMANTWCSKYRPEYLRDLITTDSHSPAEFRVNGVVSNQEDFANDFGCPKGTPMNPEIKCEVW